MQFFYIDTNSVKKNIQLYDKNVLLLENEEKIGIIEYFDYNYLFFKNNSDIIEKYKLNNGIFEICDETINDYKKNSIILYNKNNIINIRLKTLLQYENIKTNNNGFYEFYENYLIIKNKSFIYFYEYSNIHNFYNYIKEQDNFDWKYYVKNTNNLNDDNCKNFEVAFKHWLLNKNNKYCDNTSIKIENNLKNIIIDHTNLIIYENNNILYENIKIEMNVIKIFDNDKIFNYAKLNKDYYEIINCKINNYNNKMVYIISNISGGGSLKYINDLTIKYNKYTIIKDKNTLNNTKYNKNDILLVQHLLFTDININDIIFIKNKYKLNIVISIHDYYWLNNNVLYKLTDMKNAVWHSNYLLNNININKNIMQLFNNANEIIHPSLFTYKIYSKYFNNINFNLVYHNDSELLWNNKIIKNIKNKTINIGILHEMSTYKGSIFINYLKNNFKIYKNYNINYLIVGNNIPNYKEEEFTEFINKYNIHGTLLINKWGETHCYLLTKIINSGLPFIYNNFGSFIDRINLKKEHHFKLFDNENECENYEKLNSVFESMIKYIIDNNNNSIVYNNYYDNLFKINNYENNNYDFKKIHTNIKPYAIYFPQFHEIPENNKNYYKGFNDIINLDKYIKNGNNDNLETPLMNLYGLNNITEYNITNEIIQKEQINIAKSYGIAGFAIYYYWFTENKITNNNTIMENGYKYFFKNNIDNFNFYFIWANENWTNNPSFNTSENILNNYNNISYEKNVNNLMKYFKHDNYLKINNKPVLFIHHPKYIPNFENLVNFFNNKCIENGFDGINISNRNDGYTCHPEYKNKEKKNINIDEKGIKYINYEKYCNNIENEEKIECVFFDFNNSARLSIPNKLNLKTYIVNNTIENQKKHVLDIFSRYRINKNRSELNKIVLINAWNEWGEKMNIEPSNEKNDLYLSIIKNNLITIF